MLFSLKPHHSVTKVNQVHYNSIDAKESIPHNLRSSCDSHNNYDESCQGPQMSLLVKMDRIDECYAPVLKIKYHGYHGRGTKGIWGDQRDVYCFFVENIWETLLVLPESLFCPLKFSLWSSQNHCSVPSNSVYSHPKIIVLSPPNYKSLFPPKSLLCPLKFHLSCIKFRL